jgi:hypothetical protein
MHVVCVCVCVVVKVLFTCAGLFDRYDSITTSVFSVCVRVFGVCGFGGGGVLRDPGMVAWDGQVDEDGPSVHGGGVDVSEVVEVKDDGAFSTVDSEQATAGGSIVGLLELYIRQRGGRVGATGGHARAWSRASVLTAATGSTGVVSVECRPPTPLAHNTLALRGTSLDAALPSWRTKPASHRSDVAAASSNNSVASNVSVSGASSVPGSVTQYGWQPPVSRSTGAGASGSGAGSSPGGSFVGSAGSRRGVGSGGVLGGSASGAGAAGRRSRGRRQGGRAGTTSTAVGGGMGAAADVALEAGVVQAPGPRSGPPK